MLNVAPKRIVFSFYTQPYFSYEKQLRNWLKRRSIKYIYDKCGGFYNVWVSATQLKQLKNRVWCIPRNTSTDESITPIAATV
jgi:hypothetical protein